MVGTIYVECEIGPNIPLVMRFMLANEVGEDIEIDTQQMDLCTQKILTFTCLLLHYMYFNSWI